MKTKIISFFVVFLGIFAFFGLSQASTTEIIQPASIVYNENMTVNGELNVNSLRVGSEGIGGVTYFNGTIVNIGTQIPVTIGDDLRVDGMIWRGPSKGTSDGQALKIGDSMYPAITNTNSLGSTNKRWRDLFLAGALFGEDMIIGRELWGGSHKGIVDGDDPLFVSDSMYPTLDNINNLGSEDNRWLNLHLSGMLQGNNAKFSGLLEGNNATFTGDVDFSGATVTGLGISGDYLPLTGGTLSGNLTVSGVSGLTDADIPNNITVNNYLPLTGGTLTDDLIITGPTNFLHVDGYASIDNVATFGGGYGDTGVTILDSGNINLDGEITSMGGGLSQFSIMQINTELNTANSDANSILSGGFLEIPNGTEDKATSAATECDQISEYGKIYLEYDDGDLWVCTQSGWIAK